jgi:hypothetical protein
MSITDQWLDDIKKSGPDPLAQLQYEEIRMLQNFVKWPPVDPLVVPVLNFHIWALRDAQQAIQEAFHEVDF